MIVSSFANLDAMRSLRFEPADAIEWELVATSFLLASIIVSAAGWSLEPSSFQLRSGNGEVGRLVFGATRMVETMIKAISLLGLQPAPNQSEFWS